MIDTGENGDGDKLVARLAELGVEKLDLLILTHFDKDHIGGADTIVREIPIDRVVLPSYEKDSKQYAQLLGALSQSDAKVTYLTEDLSEKYGDLELSIWVSPVPFDGKSDNDQSLITKILFNGTSCLFMGDAADLYREQFAAALQENYYLAPAHLKDLRAASVAALAAEMLASGQTQGIPSHELEIDYLRKPQAEREREAKLAAEANN